MNVHSSMLSYRPTLAVGVGAAAVLILSSGCGSGAVIAATAASPVSPVSPRALLAVPRGGDNGAAGRPVGIKGRNGRVGVQPVDSASASSGLSPTVASLASLSRGGNGRRTVGDESEEDGRFVKAFGVSVAPEGRSILAMATAMALHYLAYSLARPTTLTLFTSKSTGFAGKLAAYPLAMAFVSPMSLLLLLVYGKILHRRGPREALRRTTLYCSWVLALSAVAIRYIGNLIGAAEKNGTSSSSALATVVRFIVGTLFVFRESYVQLLTSQHWSFMCSVLTPAQSSTWFAPISGLTSLTSAAAGMGVSRLVEMVGLTGVLGGAAAALALSVVASEKSYAISERYGFNPADEHFEKEKRQKEEKEAKSKQACGRQGNSVEATAASEKSGEGMVQKAADVFSRVPTLWALFCEILASQGLSTLLNVCYVTKLSQSIPDDAERAGWMGKFFAWINIVSSALQFGILPPLMSRVEPRTLWRLMPIVMLCGTSFLSLQNDASLHAVAGIFLVMKVLEFSVRRMLDEMVYVPLDFESRYVGKEVIGVFGYRFGKSGMSLALSGLTTLFGNFGLQQLSYLTSGAALVWFTSAWRLSNLVPTSAEAEAAYQRSKEDPLKQK